jgi:hypothetical protein
MMQDRGIVYVGARVDATTKHQLVALAKRTRRSESQMLRLLLDHALQDPTPEVLFERLARQVAGEGILPPHEDVVQ